MSLADDIEWMRSNMRDGCEMRKRLDRITAALAGAQATGLHSDAILEIDVPGRYVEVPTTKLPGPGRYQLHRIYTEPVT